MTISKSWGVSSLRDALAPYPWSFSRLAEGYGNGGAAWLEKNFAILYLLVELPNVLLDK